MDTTTLESIRAMLGLGPDAVVAPHQFPRIPPGLMHHATSRFAVPPSKAARGVISMVSGLDDFKQAYQRHAPRMIGADGPGAVIPPGHPLYDRSSSLGALSSERDKLLKENIELKRQLDEMRSAAPS